ncbi:MAG TPA: hypothetical protein VJ894_09155 [Cryomorphaceae bacterium]|nr:hypothetical protein [Cryomorphaceae bacterium]
MKDKLKHKLTRHLNKAALTQAMVKLMKAWFESDAEPPHKSRKKFSFNCCENCELNIEDKKETV